MHYEILVDIKDRQKIIMASFGWWGWVAPRQTSISSIGNGVRKTTLLGIAYQCS